MIHRQSTLNCRGQILSIVRPIVMGILNVSPDSFYDSGKFSERDTALKHCEQMLRMGARIIDVGAISSRPWAGNIAENQEIERLMLHLPDLLNEFPEAVFSVDTFRETVGRMALECGAHMINDIYAGRKESGLIAIASAYNAPYVAMHMLGEPATMQEAPKYDDVTRAVLHFFVDRLRRRNSVD